MNLTSKEKGGAGMTDLDLVVVAYDNAKTKDGKAQYLDVQGDGQNPEYKDNTNLHVSSKVSKDEAGKTTYDNGMPYSTKQVEAIVAAAGDNSTPLLNKQGESVGKIYGVKASVMPLKDNEGKSKGVIINTKKPMEPSQFKVDENTIKRQIDVTSKAKAERQAQAPQADKQAEAPQAVAEVENDEPQVG